MSEELKEITRLCKLIKEKDKEIKRLKKELEIEKDISDGMLETIDKAIEYIESDYILEEVGINKSYITIDKEKLLEILKKEENNESSNINREIN